MKLSQLSQSVVDGNFELSVKLIQEALASGISASTIYIDGLITGMAIIGKKMQQGECFLPEVLLSSQVMKNASEILAPILSKQGSMNQLGRIVIGTVEGDLHDIGKNLVIIMLEGAGFAVTDLGVDVPIARFVAAIKEANVDILGISAMLSITMMSMKDIIKALEDADIRQKVKIIVGGAPVNKKFADEIGADGYAPDASSAVDLAKSLLDIRRN